MAQTPDWSEAKRAEHGYSRWPRKRRPTIRKVGEYVNTPYQMMGAVRATTLGFKASTASSISNDPKSSAGRPRSLHILDILSCAIPWTIRSWSNQQRKPSFFSAIKVTLLAKGLTMFASTPSDSHGFDHSCPTHVPFFKTRPVAGDTLFERASVLTIQSKS